MTQVDELLTHVKVLDALDVLVSQLVEEGQISADSAMGASGNPSISTSATGGIRIPEPVV